MRNSILIAFLCGFAVFGAFRLLHSSQTLEISRSGALYRCAMHPSYTSHSPGACPICGMRLERIGQHTTGALSLSQVEQERAGIATTAITKASLRRDVSTTADINLDSPIALESPVNGAIVSVALQGDGPNPVPAQRGQLLMTIKPSRDANREGDVELRAPANAWITISVKQDMPVKAGTPLAYYSSVELLPLVAEIPLADVDFVKAGAPAEMYSDTDPGRVWQGSVTKLLGNVDAKSRAVKVKIEFPNTSLNMRSNLPVRVKIKYFGPSVLVVPDEAVLWRGNSWICYVADGRGGFKARTIQLGAHFNNVYQIRGGLKIGERVVSRAAFLLDSESRLEPEIRQ